MKKSKRVSRPQPAAGRKRVFRAAVFACALLVAGVATYASRNGAPAKAEPAAAGQAADPYVTVEVGGRRVRVNAQTLQQGPLTQAESQRLAEQLEGNQASEGLVQEKRGDGTVAVDLQGRFQNVTLAKRNDDGTVSAACVDTPEAAGAFLRSAERTAAIAGTGVKGKAASQK
jgi:translation initiation factor 1 (eIF-1/SUI1)